MVEINDAVQANQAVNQHMLARGYQTWSSSSKEIRLQNGLQPARVHLRNILDRVPVYLANTFTQDSWSAQLKLEPQTWKSGNSELFSSGMSTWHTSESDCDLSSALKRTFGNEIPRYVVTCSPPPYQYSQCASLDAPSLGIVFVFPFGRGNAGVC